MRRLPANRYLLFFTVALAGLAIDLGSKYKVFADLGYPARAVPPYAVGRHEVFAHPPQFEGETEPFFDKWISFRLFTSFNEGALWGFGQGRQKVFIVLGVVAVIGVLGWLFVYGAAQSAWLTFCLALIMAGTLGNLYDRLGWYDYVDQAGQPVYAVRDFLLFTFGGWPWPVFNFADVFLVTGACLLILQSLWLEFEGAKTPQEKGGATQDSAAGQASSAQATQEVAG